MSSCKFINKQRLVFKSQIHYKRNYKLGNHGSWLVDAYSVVYNSVFRVFHLVRPKIVSVVIRNYQNLETV